MLFPVRVKGYGKVVYTNIIYTGLECIILQNFMIILHYLKS